MLVCWFLKRRGINENKEIPHLREGKSKGKAKKKCCKKFCLVEGYANYIGMET